MIEAADDVEPTTTNVHTKVMPSDDLPPAPASASASASAAQAPAALAGEEAAATATTLPLPAAPQQGDDILDFNSPETAEDVEGDGGPRSSLENILPMDKIKRGWTTWTVFARSKMDELQEKVEEIKKSEQFQELRGKAEVTLKQAQEAVQPYVDKTVEVTAPYIEKAKENTAIALEKARPHVEVAVAQTADFIAKATGAAKPAAAENMTV
jgi:hypothetical protein